MCVRVSVNHEFVHVITHQPFKLGSPNLDQRCKRPWLRALSFCGMMDRDLQGQIELQSQNLPHFKDRAHLSTFHIFIFEKFSFFIVLVVFLVIVQSSEMIVWLCEKWHFFLNFISYHIFAIYVGRASLGLPIACRQIAVSGARLPSVWS